MMWFFGSIVVFTCIAAIMIATGLLILFATRNPVKQELVWRVSAIDLALSAFLGTAFWIFLSGTLSYLGFTFNQFRPWMLVLLSFFLATLFVLWFMKYMHKPVTNLMFKMLIAGFLAGAISLLPLALKNTFRIVLDPFTYVTIADFLQTHNFSTPIQANISFPAFGEAITYQQSGFRMGANFLLATITSWLSPLRSVMVYPAVLAWGLALNVFGLFLWMRWGLKSSYTIALISLFFVAMTANPVQSSAAWGFYPQTLGTAFLIFSLAILSKVLSRISSPFKLALWWGISWAAMASTYSELFPILGLTSLLSILYTLRGFHKRGRLKNLFQTIFIALVIGLLCANYEWVRMVKAISIQVKSVVGWSTSMDFFNLWSDAIGAKPVSLSWNIGFVFLSITLSLLWFIGLVLLVKKKQIIPLFIYGIWLAMVLYFWLTKEALPLKAVWSIYKITQWSFLSLIAAAFFSLNIFRLKNKRALAGATVLICILGFIPLISVFNVQGGSVQEATGTDNPIEDYLQLAQVIKAYKKNNIYQVSPAPLWPKILPGYFLMDRPILLSNWNDGTASDANQIRALKNTDTLFYCLACPFPNPRNAILPANSVVIQQPVVSELSKSDFDTQHKKGLLFQVKESEKVCLAIFSILAGDTNVQIQADPATLRVSDELDWNIELAIENSKSKSKIEFPTHRGYNSLCFQSNPPTTITILDLSLSGN